MKLTLYIDEGVHALEVPDDIIREGEDFFAKMDQDMDKGWQMNRSWVDNPDRVQRCQIAADKLLDAINRENETLLMLMAGYILSRMPSINAVRIDTAGEMTETELISSSA